MKWSLFILTAACGTLFATAAEETTASLAAPVASDPGLQPFYFSIPAPRGQILDAEGKPLARTKVVQRLTLRVPLLNEETPEGYVAWVAEYWPKVEEAYPEAERPDEESLKQQFTHRRRIPLVISQTLEVETVASIERPEFVDVQNEYEREYPNGSLAAHLIGYVTSTGAPLRGPLQYGEPLWKEVEGRQGLEASMNAELTGKAGLMVVCYDQEGRAAKRQILREPVPGRNVVTTLQLALQERTEKALKTAKRPGAMVVVDVATGDIKAMASEPTFDPNQFAKGVSEKEFTKLSKDPKQPMFNRAVSALYPPGSVFKPFVALAGLQSGRLRSEHLIPCGPEMMIDGRSFRNWTDKDSGWFNLNGAIIRSFNTYFYQAAIAIGDKPILSTARDFGFGEPINLPLASVAYGNLPKQVPSRQGLANMSIGQSPLVSSPLEVTMAMATLADGMRRPAPRLVSQVQDQEGKVMVATPPRHLNAINYPTDGMVAVHSAMYGVVNHAKGTGVKARVPGLRVYGKTGTAQWSTSGAMESAVWFAGFIKDSEPPLAYAVAIEGNKGETIFGGSVAAPVAAQVLTGIASEPAKYALQTRKVKAPIENHTLAFNSDLSIPELTTMPAHGPIAAASLPGQDVPQALDERLARSYYSDYPDAMTPPPPALSRPSRTYSSAMSPPPPGLSQPARGNRIYADPRIPGGVVVVDERGPRPVRRAIPVQEGRMPAEFYHQPPPEPNEYYERARSRPRSSIFSFGRR